VEVVEAVLAEDNDDADLDVSDEVSRDSDVDVAVSNKLADIGTQEAVEGNLK
jgi:hypothetical protein